MNEEEITFSPLALRTYLLEYGQIYGIISGNIDGTERDFNCMFDWEYRPFLFEKIICTHCHNSNLEDIHKTSEVKKPYQQHFTLDYITYGRVPRGDEFYEVFIEIQMILEIRMTRRNYPRTLVEFKVLPSEIKLGS